MTMLKGCFVPADKFLIPLTADDGLQGNLPRKNSITQESKKHYMVIKLRIEKAFPTNDTKSDC